MISYLFIYLALLQMCHGAVLPASYARTRVGLNTHMDTHANAYANPGLVASTLVGLGIGIIRETTIASTDTGNWNAAKTMWQNGIRINLIVQTNQAAADFISKAVAMETAMPGFIFTIELPNEMNTGAWPNPNFQNGWTYEGRVSTNDPSVMADVAADYYAAIKANSLLKKFPILCPTVSMGNAGYEDYLAQAVADMHGRTMCDWGNMHPYSNNDGQALPNLQYHLTKIANVEAPGKPWAITEIGLLGRVTSERQISAKFILNAIFDTFQQGGQMVIIYDAFRDTSIPNDQGFEQNFGVLNYTGSYLVQSTTMKNFFTIMHDSGNNPTNLPSLGVSFSGVSGVRTQQFLHSNGHYFIMVSAEVPIWGVTGWQNQAPRPLTVHLPAGATLLRVFDAYVSSSPVESPMTTATYTITHFTEHPIIIEISTASSSANAAATTAAAATASAAAATTSAAATAAHAAATAAAAATTTAAHAAATAETTTAAHAAATAAAATAAHTTATAAAATVTSATSTPSNCPFPQAVGDHILYAGDYLISNGLSMLQSSDCRFVLTMQVDGNLVLYFVANGNQVLWASNTTPGTSNGPYKAILQVDGNFVIFNKNGTPIWNTYTAAGEIGKPAPYHLQMQNDGNLVLSYSDNWTSMWASNTGSH